MSKLLWESVPTISEEYYSANGTFLKVEDICTEVMLTEATTYTWLRFVSDYTWPGPKVKLRGGPMQVKPWYGIREIPHGSVKVDIQNAFKRALVAMKKKEYGEQFIGKIVMYWPLTGPKAGDEPFYTFTTNQSKLIFVGAYSGDVTFE